ncbi:MAG: hypothetical protein JXM73_25305 [Anaerolineae bacterium]|nr:hypothetical protein [Anaerolineae bacterium]
MSETTESPPVQVPETERSEGEASEALPTEGRIDLQALAERVYRLLKEQARLERERLGTR